MASSALSSGDEPGRRPVQDETETHGNGSGRGEEPGHGPSQDGVSQEHGEGLLPLPLLQRGDAAGSQDELPQEHNQLPSLLPRRDSAERPRLDDEGALQDTPLIPRRDSAERAQGDYYALCRACSMTFNCSVKLSDHLAGKRHRRNMREDPSLTAGNVILWGVLWVTSSQRRWSPTPSLSSLAWPRTDPSP